VARTAAAEQRANRNPTSRAKASVGGGFTEVVDTAPVYLAKHYYSDSQ
jgi:hypothetical protein